jgi:hypothetical protein
MFRVGMTGFQLASLFGPLLSALFYRFVKRPVRGPFLALLVGAVLGLLIHPGIAVLVAAPCAVFYFFFFPRLGVKGNAGLAGALLAAVAVNIFWIWPLLHNLPYFGGSRIMLQNSRLFLLHFMVSGLRNYQVIFLLLPLAAAAGLGRLKSQKARELFWALFLALLALLVFFLAGPFLSRLKGPEPARYGVPLLFFMVLPAAGGLDGGGQAGREPGPGRDASAS